MINTVVVGYGMAGKGFHCYLIQQNPKLTLYGVVIRKNISPPELKGCCAPFPFTMLGIRIFDSLEKALQDEKVQLIVIATPNHTHAEMAIQSLNAKKHVVVGNPRMNLFTHSIDKPAALCLRDFDKMVKTAEENGKHLFIFQNRRWDGDFLTVKKLMKEGKLGQVRWVEMSWQKPGLSTKLWKNDDLKKGSGRFYDLGSHMIDQVC